MRKITAMETLRLHHRVTRSKPFGLQVTANRAADAREIAPALLEEILRKEKPVCFRGFNALEREELLQLVRAYPGAELLHWESGPVMEMKVSPAPKNYLFSTEKVPYHWDGAFHRVPSFLVFNCIEAPAKEAGGETLFCDTEAIWKDAPEAEKTRWLDIRLTYETAKLAHYGGSITVPLVQSHPRHRRPILRFAESVETELNPVSLKVHGLSPDETETFLSEMTARLYSPEYRYAHQWEANDLLIADNHSLVHGRNAFHQHCPRHLRRIQIL